MHDHRGASPPLTRSLFSLILCEPIERGHILLSTCTQTYFVFTLRAEFVTQSAVTSVTFITRIYVLIRTPPIPFRVYHRTEETYFPSPLCVHVVVNGTTNN